MPPKKFKRPETKSRKELQRRIHPKTMKRHVSCIELRQYYNTVLIDSTKEYRKELGSIYTITFNSNNIMDDMNCKKNFERIKKLERIEMRMIKLQKA